MLVFEDKSESGLSLLIKYALGDMNVFFTEGNRRVIPRFKEWYREDEANIIMLDLVPDKQSTLTAYNDIKDTFTSYNNIYVVPIPCIEYYALKAFTASKEDIHGDITIVLNRSNHYNSYIVTDVCRGKQLDFETYCKKVFLHTFSKCMHNVTIDLDNPPKLEGLFYYDDCTCSKDSCTETPMSIQNKSWMLIRELPCFFDNLNGATFSTVYIKIEDVINKCHEDYNSHLVELVNAGVVSKRLSQRL